MNKGITQVLLAAIVVLLILHLLRMDEITPVALAQAGDETQEVLRARSIELVNGEGKVVAQLYTGEDGAGNLRLRSGDGTVRVKLGASDEGAGLLLLDRETEPAVWMVANASGTSVTLAEKGKPKRIITPQMNEK